MTPKDSWNEVKDGKINASAIFSDTMTFNKFMPKDKEQHV